MIRALLLSLLWTSTLCAADDVILTLERQDAGSGKSLTFLRMARGQAHSLTSLGSMPAGDDATYGVVPTATHPPDALIFQSTRGAGKRHLRVFELTVGKLISHVIYEVADFTPIGMAPFAAGEMIAWDPHKKALVHLTGHSFEFLSPDNFLNLKDDLFDVSIARIADREVLIVGHLGTQTPNPNYPADYRIYRVRLETNGQATLLEDLPLLRKEPGVPAVLTSDGVYYVKHGFRGRNLAHAPVNGVVDRSSMLAGLVIAGNELCIPIDQGRKLDTNIFVLWDDRLREVNTTSMQSHDLIPLFSQTQLDALTKLRTSSGLPKIRFAGVSRPLYSHQRPYAEMTGATPPTAGGAERAAKQYAATIRSRFLQLWKDVAKQDLDQATTLSAESIAILVNSNPGGKAAWLVSFFADMSKDELRQHQLGYRAMGYYALSSTPVVLSDFFATLAARPNCALLLALP